MLLKNENDLQDIIDLLDFIERTIERWREKEVVMLNFGIQGFWQSVFSCEIP